MTSVLDGFVKLTDIVLVQRAFEALRLANFMLRPSFDVVQGLLVIGNCLQDYGQSDGSWVLLGTTVRLAQAMGLHTQSTEQLRGVECEKSRRMWYAVTLSYHTRGSHR